MVKVIMGAQGSGKTIDLIASIKENLDQDHNVVCIERGDALRFDVDHRARLIDAEEYAISGITLLKGFISGLHAGNFDISHIYIDNLLKILGADKNDLVAFCDWCAAFGETNTLHFTFTVSGEPEDAEEGLKKYL